MTTPIERHLQSMDDEPPVPEPRLVQNAAKCLLCGEILQSKHRHDYRTCSCGNLMVDGGLDYVRRGFKTNQWVDMCAHEGDSPLLTEIQELQPRPPHDPG